MSYRKMRFPKEKEERRQNYSFYSFLKKREREI